MISSRQRNLIVSTMLGCQLVSLATKQVEAQNLEGLSGVVVYLQQTTQTIDQSSKKVINIVENGTGFFVLKGQTPYLVTAAHVAQKMKSTAKVILRGEGDRPVSFNLLELIEKSPRPTWVFHNEADIAVLLLSPSQNVIQHIQNRFFSFDDLVSAESSPKRERVLLVLGFPLGLGVEGRFSPVSQEFKASSGLLRMSRFDSRTLTTFFLLDRPSVSGFSGAPIFETAAPYHEGAALVFPGINQRPKCVGVVHGTVFDNTGGKFAAVTPSVFIAETIARTQIP